MNYLQKAAETLQRNMERDAGLTVMYHRQGIPAFPVVAVPGRTQADNDSGTGFIVRTVTRDWVIRKALLKAKGISEPKRNDKIVVKFGDDEHTFLVNGDSGISHWDEADSYNIAYRIHSLRDTVNNA